MLTPHRKPQRYHTDRAELHELLDEALVCHLATVVGGMPQVIPTYHARIGEMLYLHASTGSGTGLRAKDDEVTVSVAVTLLDGLVYSRTATDHSMNYRSAVIHGRAHGVRDVDVRRRVTAALIDKVAAGRSAEVAPPTAAEDAATAMLALGLDHWTFKRRTGGVTDGPELQHVPTWAGVVPVKLVAQAPEPDAGVDLPAPPLPVHLVSP